MLSPLIERSDMLIAEGAYYRKVTVVWAQRHGQASSERKAGGYE
jgi:hypothetical protein